MSNIIKIQPDAAAVEAASSAAVALRTKLCDYEQRQQTAHDRELQATKELSAIEQRAMPDDEKAKARMETLRKEIAGLQEQLGRDSAELPGLLAQVRGHVDEVVSAGSRVNVRVAEELKAHVHATVRPYLCGDHAHGVVAALGCAAGVNEPLLASIVGTVIEASDCGLHLRALEAEKINLRGDGIEGLTAVIPWAARCLACLNEWTAFTEKHGPQQVA